MKPSENPFRYSQIVKYRYQIGSADFESLRMRLASCKFRASIRGPHGTGKSTLLEDLATSYSREGKLVKLYRVNKQDSSSKRKQIIATILSSHPSEMNFLDGGECFGYFAWNWFIARCIGKNLSCIATTHYPCVLAEVFVTHISLEQTLQMIQHLSQSYWSCELNQVALRSFNNSKGNCRDILRDCYLFMSHRQQSLCHGANAVDAWT